MTAPFSARRRDPSRHVGLGVADGDEADPGAGPALAEQAMVGRGHHRHDRVTAQCGVVRHQDDGVAIRRHLHRPGDHGL